MWKNLKLKAFIKTYVLTGEALPIDWSKYQAEPKDKPFDWEPCWGVIQEPLDAATTKRFVARSNGFLSYWSSITPEAAFILSKYSDKDNAIWLDGLKSLTDECADLIGSAAASGLHLSSLRTLSDSAADSLSRVDTDGNSHFEELSLDGLKSLSAAAAQSLGRITYQLRLG